MTIEIAKDKVNERTPQYYNPNFPFIATIKLRDVYFGVDYARIFSPKRGDIDQYRVTIFIDQQYDKPIKTVLLETDGMTIVEINRGFNTLHLWICKYDQPITQAIQKITFVRIALQ